ncbi:hypothetical protein B1H10_01240 [candidate division KSB1 bacterium 4484_188]|nr:MAG: hypothetical protein B1H10_01240 [candidate division KSB1 bacterium 4484_188]HHE38578.1 hypothetical protein [Candidatus Cloacimonadota bacterium]
MWHGRIKLVLGLWLVLSGVFSSFQSPINMMIVGFLAGVCCFRSYKLWQAAATGIIGLWLFLCGLSYLFSSMVVHLMTPENFIISGVLLSIFGLWCIIHHAKELTVKTA